MKVKQIVTNIETQDISKAKHFYEEILGLDQLMNMDFIVTYGSHEKIETQISFLSEGGSGTPAPDLSNEVIRVLIPGRRFAILDFQHVDEYAQYFHELGIDVSISRKHYLQFPFVRSVNFLSNAI
ncbi:glyoxalase [Lentibacillus sp. L22]